MKKILFIITKSENGGAQKWVKEQIEILENKFEIYLVTDEKGWLFQNVKMNGYMTDYRIRNRFSLCFFFKFIKFLKKNNIDLIIASSANAGVYSRLSKIFYKAKVIYVGHGWSSIYNGGNLKWLYTKIEKFLSYFTDSILCISKSDFDKAKNEIKIDVKKLHLIPNKIKSIPHMKKNEKHFPPRVLSVARFKHPKRIDLLLRVAKDLDIELYLVGDGPLKKDLEEQYKDKKIYFLGEIEGFEDFYKYDIFALISESEGLPLSAIEAMSAGLPLVLSNVGGCSELIDGNGVLVENNLEDIAKGIQKCIEKQEKFGKRSKELFDEKFSLEKFKEEYVEYYQNVLDSFGK